MGLTVSAKMYPDLRVGLFNKRIGSSIATLSAWCGRPGAPRAEHKAVVFAQLGPSTIT